MSSRSKISKRNFASNNQATACMENSNKRIRIAVDAMGSDSAPKSEIEGSLLAIQANNADLTNYSIEIVLVGNKEIIEKNFSQNNISINEMQNNISIIDAKEVITMHDDPVASLKNKTDSSMLKGIQLLKEGKVDGYVSAGNTGATLTVATMILGRISGVTRPTIGVFFPTIKNKPVFLADVGATVECRARFLYEYAIMGSIYSKAVFGIENPSVGLLNVGEEDTKGAAEHLEAFKNFKASNLNFYGNVEGNDILKGTVDIVVTDGYTGNVIIKFAEGFLSLFNASLKQYKEKNADKKDKLDIAVPIIKELLLGFNYEEYGGTPLLGVKGTVIIGHGSSTPKAIKNMIFSAISSIEKNVCGKIEQAIA